MKRKEAITKSTLEHFKKTQDEMVNIMCPGSFGLGPICDNKTRKIIQNEKGTIKIIGCKLITCEECWNKEYEGGKLMQTETEETIKIMVKNRIENRAKTIIDVAVTELMEEIVYKKNNECEYGVAEERAEEILIDILVHGRIKESEEILEKISKDAILENIKKIDKIINLMAINDVDGNEILERVKRNIYAIGKHITNKIERTIEIHIKTDRSWREIEFKILKEGDIFRLIEPDGNFVIDKKGRKEFTAISNAYKNDDGILTIRVAV